VTSATDAEKVRNVLQAFFEGLDTHNEAAVRESWHPDAMLFVNGSELDIRPLSFLLGLPGQVRFELEEIRHIDVHGAIATARADYKLSVGIHAGFFNLVQVGGKWLIANWVDHGVETE
jgi:hypothetical protein